MAGDRTAFACSDGPSLHTAMGPLIAAALEDPDVVEIMLNPDRTLWVDRLSSGSAPLGATLSEADGERIIRLVAAHVGAEVHSGQPLLSAELPETGERFEGILPPAAPAPAFALRKRAVGVIPLDRYVADGMMRREQADFLRGAVHERQNILIAGGTIMYIDQHLSELVEQLRAGYLGDMGMSRSSKRRLLPSVAALSPRHLSAHRRTLQPRRSG